MRSILASGKSRFAYKRFAIICYIGAVYPKRVSGFYRTGGRLCTIRPGCFFFVVHAGDTFFIVCAGSGLRSDRFVLPRRILYRLSFSICQRLYRTGCRAHTLCGFFSENGIIFFHKKVGRVIRIGKVCVVQRYVDGTSCRRCFYCKVRIIALCVRKKAHVHKMNGAD